MLMLNVEREREREPTYTLNIIHKSFFEMNLFYGNFLHLLMLSDIKLHENNHQFKFETNKFNVVHYCENPRLLRPKIAS